MNTDPSFSGLSKYFKTLSNLSLSFKDAKVNFTGKNQDEENNSNAAININAHIKGGELALVMGKNSSLFLQGLARPITGNTKGSILLKNYDYNMFARACPQQVIYSNEQDDHFPFLTVQQTIDFAINCKVNGEKGIKNAIRETLLNEFGLSHARDTIVGNDRVRGISGGERKRLSIIETFIAHGSLYLWDNSSKGLDSSTALEFFKCLRSMAHLTQTVNLVKISQASDKLMSCFDKVLVFLDDQQVFYGTLKDCIRFFMELGYSRDPTLCDLEYLTAIVNGSLASRTITSTEDVVRCWRQSIYCTQSVQELDSFINARQILLDKCNEADLTPLYDVSVWYQLKYCTIRAFHRAVGDKVYMIAQFISILVQSLVIGSLFYNIPRTTIGSYSRGSITFFALLFFTFICLAEVPISFARRSVINKQRKLFFYKGWTENLSTVIFDMPYRVILIIVFSLILYFIAHFQFSAARFFIFLLFLVIVNFSMASLFQWVANASPTISMANAVSGVLLLAIAMYASYVIYLKSMHPWFKWIAYINPVMYAMESILSNEMLHMQLDCTESIIPRGPTYNNVSFDHKVCGWQGAKLGHASVQGKEYLSDALAYSYKHTWRNFGILIGFSVFFCFCSVVTFHYITPLYDERIKTSGRGRDEKDLFDSATNEFDISESDSLDDDPSIGKIENIMDSKQINTRTKTHQQISEVHTLSWKDINYTVNDKKLLNNVSGYVSTGLTALLGESGAGKTTLLDTLSHRIEGGVVSGEILVDGHPIDQLEAFKANIGYVQQQDVHLGLLTVRESLKFSSLLRGNNDVSYVEEVLHMLKLNGNTFIKDLSPTNKKLLSIGVELVAKPSLLLFLDEPTSGLDTEAAITIIKFLKKLSMQGQAILCSIHQPSRNIFSYFDNVIVLKAGGETAYMGPTTIACDYFSQRSSLFYDPHSDSPADFIIETVGERSSEKSCSNWAELWKASDEGKKVTHTLQQLEQHAVISGESSVIVQKERITYLNQLMIVTKRQYLTFIRDRSYIASKFLLNVVSGLFIGFTFWKTKHNIIGLQNLVFATFMVLCISSPLVHQIQDKALEAKDVFTVRESKSSTFHWSVLILSQVLVELPFVLGSSTVLFLCFYFCLGVNNSPHIAGVYYFNYMLFSIYYLTFGLGLLYATADLQTASVLIAFFFSFTVSFCGVMQPYSLFPRFWTFMYRVSPYTYFVDTFVSLLLHDRKVTCDTSELAPTMPLAGQTCGEFMKAFIDEYGGYLLNPSAPYVCAYCTYDSGDEFLKIQNMSYSHRWRNFGICCAYIAFNIFSMLAGFYFVSVKRTIPKFFRSLVKLFTRQK